MSSSQIYTIGTALRRAEDNGIPVEVLVEGQWLGGSVAGLDGDGLVLLTAEQIQCVVRNADISVVRLMARLPQDEAPGQPDETPHEHVVRDAPAAGHDRDRTRQEARAWAMPAGEAAPDTDDRVRRRRGLRPGRRCTTTCSSSHATADEGPLELEAPVSSPTSLPRTPSTTCSRRRQRRTADVEAEPEASVEDLAEDLSASEVEDERARRGPDRRAGRPSQEAEEEAEWRRASAPCSRCRLRASSHDSSRRGPRGRADRGRGRPGRRRDGRRGRLRGRGRADGRVAVVDEVDGVDETETEPRRPPPRSAGPGRQRHPAGWRDMLIALAPRPPPISARPAPERRRSPPARER